jgi:hypothetical protein
MQMTDPFRISCLLIASSFLLPAAHADTLSVGPGSPFPDIAHAALAAKSGDTVLIAQGTYTGCAVWRADNLTIRGLGSGAQFGGPVCRDKAIFIIQGGHVSIDNIGFANAQSTDGNGAGIRAEGGDLLVENSRFTNNQEGILSGGDPQTTITVRNSTFTHNGACFPKGCAHGIYVGHIASLRVENSRFLDTQSGHAIKSRAASTQISGCDIEDGPTGTASYLVDLPIGGDLTISKTVMEKGPMAQNHTTAISIGEGGPSNPTSQLLVTDDTFTNNGPATVFVTNDTTISAQLAGNKFRGNAITPLKGPGAVQ